MLASGIIETSSSPYSSPIVMAPKKDGKFRFCVDFRRLNSITEDSAQPLPVIQEVLKDLGEATVFFTLDLRSESRSTPPLSLQKVDSTPLRWRLSGSRGGKDVHAARRTGGLGRPVEEVLHALPVCRLRVLEKPARTYPSICTRFSSA
jgi:hypothetical protein